MFLKILQKLQESTCARVTCSKVTCATLVKKRLRNRCFPVKFFELVTNTFSAEHVRVTSLNDIEKAVRIFISTLGDFFQETGNIFVRISFAFKKKMLSLA